MTVRTALVLLANGVEEIEAVATIDILRRADVAVTSASITDSTSIKCSRNITIFADCSLDEVQDQEFDAVILPGGLGGSRALAVTAKVGKLLKKQESRGKVIAAICAAPTALKAHGIGKGKKITSYPAMRDDLLGYYEYLEDDVVIDGNLITSRGPGTVIHFALTIVEKLSGKTAALMAARGMLYKNYS